MARHLAYAALLAGLLGMILGGSIVIAIVLPAYRALSFYLAVLSLFHFCEYLFTALYHEDTVSHHCNLAASH